MIDGLGSRLHADPSILDWSLSGRPEKVARFHLAFSIGRWKAHNHEAAETNRAVAGDRHHDRSKADRHVCHGCDRQGRRKIPGDPRVRRACSGRGHGPDARAVRSRGGARRRKLGPWVRLGLAESRVFQAAVPITPSNHQNTAQNFFLEAVQATNVRAEDRIVELIKLDLAGRGLACVAASPRGVVESLIGMISRLGARVGLIEPGPAALFRAGAYYQKPPRGSKLCVAFFSASTRGSGSWPPGPVHSSGITSTYPKVKKLPQFWRPTLRSG